MIDIQQMFEKACDMECLSPTDAIKLYQEIIDHDPKHAASWINLGAIYYLQGSMIKAEAHFREAIAIDPKYALGHFNLGTVLDDLGRYEDAIASYRLAVILYDDYADAWYNLAHSYLTLKQPGKALKCYRKYLKLDKEDNAWTKGAKDNIKIIVENSGLKVVHRSELCPPQVLV